MARKQLSAGRIAAQSVWPSIRRAFSTVLAAFSLPLLLLAAISGAKLLSAMGLLEPVGLLRSAIAWQNEIIDYIRGLLAVIQLAVPRFVFDVALIWIFIGNAVARAERDELLAVELDEGEALPAFRKSLREGRVEYFFYSLPGPARWLAIRLLWPLAAIYRLGTPWVVDGPGPTGEEISTSVRRTEITNFAAMVRKAGQWSKQTVFDHRQVLLFQIIIGLASSLALQGLAKLL